MTYLPKMQIPPPERWEDFEDLCCGLWKAIWSYPGTKKNGRRGQKQNGVDIHGRPNNGDNWAGVQCKGKDNYTHKQLSEKEIKKESQKAKKFEPKINEYIIAYTAPRDQNIQRIANLLSDEYRDKGWFSIDVMSWEDIVQLLYEHNPPCASDYYPQIFGGKLTAVAGKIFCLLERAMQPSGSTSSEIASSHFPADNQSNIYTAANHNISEDRCLSAEEMKVAVDLVYKTQQELFRMDDQGGDSADNENLAKALLKAWTNASSPEG